MGKRHRQRRSIDKRTLARLGCKETELGELRRTLSKTEARRLFLQRRYCRNMAHREIMDALSKKAAEDLAAEEDARVIAFLESEIARLTAATP